jgi:hypothetical protein
VATNPDLKNWLPVSLREVELKGWDEIDVIIFSGDAYVDHPSFGPAVIGRVIEDEGFRVAIVPQPNWKDDLRDFRKLGKPKYFLVLPLEIWIQWSTIIQQPEDCVQMMLILPEEKPGSDLIILLLFTVKF